MTCQDVDDRIEAVVAGDEPATEAFRTHVEGCLRCAAAVATARRLEHALAARPVAVAPARFAAMVQGRIRRERWQAEQHVDRLFNLVLGFAVLLIIVATWALMNLSGVTEAVAAGLTLTSQMSGRLLAQAAPAAPTYLLAGGLLLTALIAWWWAEQRLSL
jgi:hypothetical protein